MRALYNILAIIVIGFGAVLTGCASQGGEAQHTKFPSASSQHQNTTNVAVSINSYSPAGYVGDTYDVIVPLLDFEVESRVPTNVTIKEIRFRIFKNVVNGSTLSQNSVYSGSQSFSTPIDAVNDMITAPMLYVLQAGATKHFTLRATPFLGNPNVSCHFTVEIVSITTMIGSTTTTETVGIIGNDITVGPAATLSLQATSPSGVLVGSAGQVVMRMAIKASNFADENWSGMKFRIASSSVSAQFTNLTIRRGSQFLARKVNVQVGVPINIDTNLNGFGDTAIQPQFIVSGTTDFITVELDTQNIRNGTPAGQAVSFTLVLEGLTTTPGNTPTLPLVSNTLIY